MQTIGKMDMTNKVRFKTKMDQLLANGGEKREVNEWYFFYDERNFYRGYCLITEWEEMNEDKGDKK